MNPTPLTPLVPLHDAIASLRSNVGRYLLAAQETGPASETSSAARAALARSYAECQVAQEAADEIHEGSGRPRLFVLAGGRANRQATTAASAATTGGGEAC